MLCTSPTKPIQLYHFSIISYDIVLHMISFDLSCVRPEYIATYHTCKIRWKTMPLVNDDRIPAEQRKQEIEKGRNSLGIRLFENPNEIFSHMKYVIENASKRLICSSSGAMQLVYDKFFNLYKKILDKHRRGEGDGIRWLTIVDKENKDLVKVFTNAGVHVRHVRNLPPMNFVVDDKYFHATIDKMEDGKIMQSLLTSNESKYVNYYSSLFEELWDNGIDADIRIRDIEGGIDSAN